MRRTFLFANLMNPGLLIKTVIGLELAIVENIRYAAAERKAIKEAS